MTNRYQSIVDNIAGDFLASLATAEQYNGTWTVVDGQLALIPPKGKPLVFDFEKGDPLSEMLIEFLNTLPYLAAAAKGLTK